ncbi:putative uncharacterized protein DDB_G0271982 [Drosophila ficusphila]|uniref:putative uncharacterized protein DDB_G0271982 n=1 Tax=Drosophila ficusphila TaxID=30025 RepID=UPI0007E7A3D0|nr:putative uncharacterized protein DDB_G0271982 [Drosophila ficusphila]
MDSSQTVTTAKEREQYRKEREQERKDRERERRDREREKREQEREKRERERELKKEQERERKREQELERQRRKDREREKEQERQKQLEWKHDLDKELKRERELERDRQKQEASKKPNSEIAKFDEEFQRVIADLERQVVSLDFRSKTMATMWMDKLRQTPHNAAEARSRNIIAAHLLKCRGENIFTKEPFNHPPPVDNLSTIREKMYLTRDSMCHGMPLAKEAEPNSHLVKLFNDSYDGGEFLSRLPVPRDGSFFILHLHPNL